MGLLSQPFRAEGRWTSWSQLGKYVVQCFSPTIVGSGANPYHARKLSTELYRSTGVMGCSIIHNSLEGTRNMPPKGINTIIMVLPYLAVFSARSDINSGVKGVGYWPRSRASFRNRNP